jgi:hypothetical protein
LSMGKGCLLLSPPLGVLGLWVWGLSQWSPSEGAEVRLGEGLLTGVEISHLQAYFWGFGESRVTSRSPVPAQCVSSLTRQDEAGHSYSLCCPLLRARSPGRCVEALSSIRHPLAQRQQSLLVTSSPGSPRVP